MYVEARVLNHMFSSVILHLSFLNQSLALSLKFTNSARLSRASELQGSACLYVTCDKVIDVKLALNKSVRLVSSIFFTFFFNYNF